jgi:hypothetical protein
MTTWISWLPGFALFPVTLLCSREGRHQRNVETWWNIWKAFLKAGNASYSPSDGTSVKDSMTLGHPIPHDARLFEGRKIVYYPDSRTELAIPDPQVIDPNQLP